MQIPFMDITGAFPEIYDEILQKLQEIISSGRFIGGKEVEQFEQEFAHFCRVNHAVGCANGTDALIIALKALGIGVGDCVITVPNTFTATAEAIMAVGARPEFVDIDEKTYTMSPEALLEHLKTRKSTQPVKAVIPVHLYGQMADMPAIVQIAKSYGLAVIEDAAQAHGAKWKGKGPGEYGDMATFSFYPGKNLGAFGDAGAIVTNSKTLAARLKMLTNHGRKEKYIHELIGYNSRLDAIQAAVLRIKLRYLNEWNHLRMINACYYDRYIKSDRIIKPYVAPCSQHVFHLYVIRVKEREEVRHQLKPIISTQIHYPLPLHLQPAYRCLGYKEGDFPVTEQIAKEILSLPMWPELKKEEIKYICEQVDACLNQLKEG